MLTSSVTRTFQNSRYFRCPVWKTKSWLKKQTYTNTEPYKLYSRAFWILLPNVIKIDLYNFQLYRFKVGAFFSETQCMSHSLFPNYRWSAFCRWQYASMFVEVFMVGSVNFCLFLQEWRFGCLRSSKVIDFGTNRKRVCDFLLVRHSNFGPILHWFKDTAGFLSSWPHPYSTQFLGCSRWTRLLMLGQWEQRP